MNGVAVVGGSDGSLDAHTVTDVKISGCQFAHVSCRRAEHRRRESVGLVDGVINTEGFCAQGLNTVRKFGGQGEIGDICQCCASG